MTKPQKYGILIKRDQPKLNLIYGEMSERFKELVLKTSDPVRDRGFESHSLRQQKTHFCLPTKVRFLNDVCLRQMMTASPNDVRFANDVWLRHILWQTSHHCKTKWSNIIFAKQMHHIAVGDASLKYPGFYDIMSLKEAIL